MTTQSLQKLAGSIPHLDPQVLEPPARGDRPSTGAPAVEAAGPPETLRADISFVVPIEDERASIVELRGRISSQFAADDRIELIVNDDGSRDDSREVIRSMAAVDPAPVRGPKFRRDGGKATAPTAGFRAATGSLIFTPDADLRDDPAEIPRPWRSSTRASTRSPAGRRPGTTPGMTPCRAG